MRISRWSEARPDLAATPLPRGTRSFAMWSTEGRTEPLAASGHGVVRRGRRRRRHARLEARGRPERPPGHGVNDGHAATSAVIVTVGVFSIFATLSMLMFKQFGVG